jgi:hypothetical protein
LMIQKASVTSGTLLNDSGISLCISPHPACREDNVHSPGFVVHCFNVQVAANRAASGGNAELRLQPLDAGFVFTRA